MRSFALSSSACAELARRSLGVGITPRRTREAEREHVATAQAHEQLGTRAEERRVARARRRTGGSPGSPHADARAPRPARSARSASSSRMAASTTFSYSPARTAPATAPTEASQRAGSKSRAMRRVGAVEVTSGLAAKQRLDLPRIDAGRDDDAADGTLAHEQQPRQHETSPARSPSTAHEAGGVHRRRSHRAGAVAARVRRHRTRLPRARARQRARPTGPRRGPRSHGRPRPPRRGRRPSRGARTRQRRRSQRGRRAAWTGRSRPAAARRGIGAHLAAARRRCARRSRGLRRQLASCAAAGGRARGRQVEEQHAFAEHGVPIDGHSRVPHAAVAGCPAIQYTGVPATRRRYTPRLRDGSMRACEP